MYDVEKVVSARIERSRKYIDPKINPALVRMHEIEIKTLQRAPRDEARLQSAMHLLKRRIGAFNNVLFLEKLYAERDALEWLLQVIRLKDTYHAEDGIV